MSERVPLGPFQKAFLEQQQSGAITPGVMALRLGWTRTCKGRQVGDGQRVLRYLGFIKQKHRITGVPVLRQAVNYETGLRLCRALGLDPVDVGV